MLDYNQLEALYWVARAGSFKSAARQLGITQSAVTQRIKQLETLVGQPVIVRSLPTKPTALGQQLLKHLTEVQLLQQALPLAGLSPALPIAVNSESLSTWFLPAIEPFAKKHRSLLELYVDDQDLTTEWMKQGKVLACVTSVEAPSSGCAAIFLGGMRYCCVASPEFAKEFFKEGVTEKTLAAAPTAIYGKNDKLNETFFRGEEITFRYSYVPSPEGLVEFARRGLAYAVLPLLAVQDDIAANRLVNLFPKNKFLLPLYWHRVDVRSSLIDELTRCVIDFARKQLSQ